MRGRAGASLGAVVPDLSATNILIRVMGGRRLTGGERQLWVNLPFLG
jgi:hypothetical protein